MHIMQMAGFLVMARNYSHIETNSIKVTASLIAQLVKYLPATQETLVQFLCGEDPLEKGKATHSSILAWRIPWTV